MIRRHFLKSLASAVGTLPVVGRLFPKPEPPPIPAVKTGGDWMTETQRIAYDPGSGTLTMQLCFDGELACERVVPVSCGGRCFELPPIQFAAIKEPDHA
jgi:hypothetical protein